MHLLLGIPGMDTGEIDMLPTERRGLFQQFVRDISATLTQMGDGTAEIDRVPMHDGTDHVIEAGGPERLTVKERSRISPRA